MTENSVSQVEQPPGEPSSVLLARRVRFARSGETLGQTSDELVEMTMAASQNQEQE